MFDPAPLGEVIRVASIETRITVNDVVTVTVSAATHSTCRSFPNVKRIAIPADHETVTDSPPNSYVSNEA